MLRLPSSRQPHPVSTALPRRPLTATWRWSIRTITLPALSSSVAGTWRRFGLSAPGTNTPVAGSTRYGPSGYSKAALIQAQEASMAESAAEEDLIREFVRQVARKYGRDYWLARAREGRFTPPPGQGASAAGPRLAVSPR